MRRTWVGLAVMLVFAATTLGFTGQDKKYTVKQVMKEAHGRNGVLNKVKAGNATAAEKAKLVEYYQSMPESKPNQGDDAAYKKLTESMLTAAKAAQKNETGWKDKLNKATNCKACHDLYK